MFAAICIKQTLVGEGVDSNVLKAVRKEGAVLSVGRGGALGGRSLL